MSTRDRGLYTAEHRAAEEAVRSYLEELMGVKITAMPATYPLDWFAHRDGEVRWWAELKCRDVLASAYPTVYLSVLKHSALMLSTLLTHEPALFVVRFTDAVYGIEARQVNTWGALVRGRTDRGARHDLEPMFNVPIKTMDYYGVWPPP